jgi:hypothetical protein
LFQWSKYSDDDARMSVGIAERAGQEPLLPHCPGRRNQRDFSQGTHALQIVPFSLQDPVLIANHKVYFGAYQSRLLKSECWLALPPTREFC